MQKNQASAVSSQAARIANNSQDLADMEGTIARLQENLAQAKSDLTRYSRTFVWPGRLSRGMVEKLRLQSYLLKFTCYGEGQVQLSQMRASVERRIDELQKASAATTGLKAVNQGSSEGLKALSNGVKSSAKAPASPARPKGKSVPNGQSDVTGLPPKR
jgi:hypothetical protein